MQFTDAKNHIVRVYQQGNRDTVFFRGPPGIGKTTAFRAAAEELGIEYINYPVPGHDPLDTGGVPAVFQVGEEFKSVRVPLDELMPTKGSGILCFDDLPNAPMQTQVSLYPILWDRQVGKRKLGDDWLVGVTGNRAEDRTGANNLPRALESRMIWLDFDADIDGHIQHLAIRQGSPLVMAFLKHRPDLFVTFNPNVPGQYATGRTWDLLSNQLMAYHTDRTGELPPWEIIKGCVGEGPATEFQAYATMAAELVSPDEIFLNPETCPVPDNPGALYAVTTALASRVTDGNFHQACQYLTRCNEEFAVFCIKSILAMEAGKMQKLSDEDRKKFKTVKRTQAFVQFGMRYKDLLS